MNHDLIAELSAIVGGKNILIAEDKMTLHLREERGLYIGRATAVVKPATTSEVADVVKCCARHGVPIVPQGGNTGLVGAGVPDQSGTAVVLSLTRMTALRDIDLDGDTMTVEAGVILQKAQDIAAEHGRLFPLSLASEGSCSIGGNIASNAGGTAVLAYGNMRDLVVGLEVVLADGRIWNGLRKLKKDNTGYDLRHLFIGSEGTLGIVTAAVLKLFPAPSTYETAFVAVETPVQAIALFRRARAVAGSALVACELIPRIGLEFVLRHAQEARDPLTASHKWYVLLELAAPNGEGLRDRLEIILEGAMEAEEVTDAVLAETVEQRARLWKLRHMLSEVQKREGGSIKHDVSVPVAAIPDFLKDAAGAVEDVVHGCRPVPFGHIGDGNIHFNVSQPPGMDEAAYLANWGAMNDVVHGLVTHYGGSISAEHGIGRLKRDLLPEVKDAVEMDLMRRLKQMFDPAGTFNPGVML